MMAQTPILTLHIILIFQRNTIGRIERMKSVAAAIAMNHGISSVNMLAMQNDDTYFPARFPEH